MSWIQNTCFRCGGNFVGRCSICTPWASPPPTSQPAPNGYLNVWRLLEDLGVQCNEPTPFLTSDIDSEDADSMYDVDSGDA